MLLLTWKTITAHNWCAIGFVIVLPDVEGAYVFALDGTSITATDVGPGERLLELTSELNRIVRGARTDHKETRAALRATGEPLA